MSDEGPDTGGIVELLPLPEPTLGRLSLDALADAINEAHDSAQAFARDASIAVSGALRYAMRAGDGLLAARQKVGPGDWTTWVNSNCRFDVRTAKNYQRIAHYRTLIDRWLTDGGSGQLMDAIEQLRGLPQVVAGQAAAPDAKDPGLRAVARRLHSEGATYHQIGKELGVNYSTVRGWIDREWRRDKKRRDTANATRRKQAERALAREEQAKAVKVAGGDEAVVYALLRRAAAALDAAMGERPTGAHRDALRDALRHVHLAEDEISRAIRVSANGSSAEQT